MQQHPPPPASPTKASATAVVNHYTRPLGGGNGGVGAFAKSTLAAEPTMTQLLAAEGTGLAHYSRRNQHEGGGDATMGNATGVLSWRKGQGFKEWEKVKLASAEVKRKADVAQLCTSSSSLSLLPLSKRN
jgi:cell cycle protein kinase DBF2